MIKYIDRTISGKHSLEISFVGMEWEDNGKEIEKNASVSVSLLESRAKLSNDIAPYVEKWTKEFPEIFVPTGVWHGIKLGLLFNEKCFVALGESICELSKPNGSVLWKTNYAKTPIAVILLAPDETGIYVLYSSFHFLAKGARSNLMKIGFSGDLIWTAKTNQVNDSFTTIRLRDNSLFANTWDGWYAYIDADSGEMINAEWTK
jgi:hypothetical protein